MRDPIYEGPIDLLLLHIAVPFTLEYVHPRAGLKVFIYLFICFLPPFVLCFALMSNLHQTAITEYLVAQSGGYAISFFVSFPGF